MKTENSHHEVHAEVVVREIELLKSLLVRVLLSPRHRAKAHFADY